MVAQIEAAGFQVKGTGKTLNALIRELVDPDELADDPTLTRGWLAPDGLLIVRDEEIVVCVEATKSSGFAAKADKYAWLARLMDSAGWSLVVIEAAHASGWVRAAIVAAFWWEGEYEQSWAAIRRLPWGAITQEPNAYDVAFHGSDALGKPPRP
jgi:hypothetical protein